MATLQIYDPRERAIVAAGDVLLAAGAALAAPFRRRRKPRAFRRILLLRLERIGDLLMALPAFAALRTHAPDAQIDLVVGSWNADLARAIPSVNGIETLDGRWLARDGSGAGLASMLKTAAGWRGRQYDLAINFEPDVRTNLVIAAAGARWTVGYRSAGGGPLLDEALEFDPRRHTTDNALRLVATVLGDRTNAAGALLDLPENDRRRAARLLEGAGRPLVAVHVSGGRPIKQWPVERFAAVSAALADRRGATIVLTGAPADRPLIETVKQTLGARPVVDASGVESLVTLAAVLGQCDLLVTGDTGPMHLAGAVGTPIVAVFGPSDPRRYAPRGARDRVVRIDLPCAPCNRIRLPPERCTGGTPDCLAGVSEEAVTRAALEVLDAR